MTITDHDCIDGALTLAGRSDFLIGCEVAGIFADDRVRVQTTPCCRARRAATPLHRIRNGVTALTNESVSVARAFATPSPA